MALQFRPPEDLINDYLKRPSSGQEASAAIGQGIQGYAQSKAQQAKLQNDALNQYVAAFAAGGPKFAGDVAARIGLKNPPALPGATAAQVPAGGTAGVSYAPGTEGVNPAEDASQQSLPSQHVSPLIQASLAMGHPNHAGIQVAGLENPDELLNQGAYGLKQLSARESVQKLKDSQSAAQDKRDINAPASFDEVNIAMQAAGHPEIAKQLIANAQAQGQNTIQRKSMDAAMKGLNVRGMNERGDFYKSQIDLNRQKFDNELLQQGNKNLNPNAATGALKPQAERLNRIGRAEALVAQMSKQKGAGDTRQMRELATSLATVLTGGNVVAQSQIEELVPRTYKGNAMAFLEKLSNNPTGLEQQEFISRLADTLGREKQTINTQINAAQNQALPAMGVLKQRNPQGYQGLIDANVNNPAYQNPPPSQSGPHGATVMQNGHVYTWNGTNYE